MRNAADFPPPLEGIESELYRFPAVDPPSLRAAVESLIRGTES